MGLGQQKEAATPGKNDKRYLAGALDVRTAAVHWVEAEKKDSYLFLALLKKLTMVYAKARVIVDLVAGLLIGSEWPGASLW